MNMDTATKQWPSTPVKKFENQDLHDLFYRNTLLN